MQLDLAYEDVGDPDPSPVGIGRSSEFILQLEANTPSRSSLASFASINANAPQVIASPEFYASHHLFGGRWCVQFDLPREILQIKVHRNVPDYSTSGSKALEKRKSDLLDFYVAVR